MHKLFSLKKLTILTTMLLVIVLMSCHSNKQADQSYASPSPMADNEELLLKNDSDSTQFKNDLVAYAQTLQGIPYKYGSTDSAQGFDCSGFITHVFNHFDMQVPRSSVDFTNYGQEIPKEMAVPGDLILFTGTDSAIRIVGHMGIIVHNGPDGLQFIHSTSGKAYGVTITPLNDYYMGRFVKTIRVIN